MQHFVKLCCLLGLLTTSAHAMMAPEYYRKAREEAPYHVQVAISRVTPPPSGPGTCMVEGKIVEVFKDTSAKLTVGTPIRFPIACYRSGDVDRVPIGGTIWTDLEALTRARYVEVYLVDAGDGFDTALWQSQIIDAPRRPDPVD
jgi:hypothetical protein